MKTSFASRMARVQPSAIRELLQLGADPPIMSFGSGYPDASLFPLEQFDAVFRETIAIQGARLCKTPYPPATHACERRSRHGWHGMA